MRLEKSFISFDNVSAANYFFFTTNLQIEATIKIYYDGLSTVNGQNTRCFVKLCFKGVYNT